MPTQILYNSKLYPIQRLDIESFLDSTPWANILQQSEGSMKTGHNETCQWDA